MIKVGDEVEFSGKDSYFRGTVVSIFTKLNGVDVRCVVQDSRGLLLIKNPSSAKLLPIPQVDEPLKIDFDDRE